MPAQRATKLEEFARVFSPKPLGEADFNFTASQNNLKRPTKPSLSTSLHQNQKPSLSQ